MPTQSLRFVNPATMPAPNGYSQLVLVPPGARLVHVAGQVGVKTDGSIAAPDFAGQAAQAFENVQAALAAAGTGFDQVIKLNMFVTDFATQLQTLREIRDRYVNRAAPPASTTLQVARFFRDGLLFELDAVAVIPD